MTWTLTLPQHDMDPKPTPIPPNPSMSWTLTLPQFRSGCDAGHQIPAADGSPYTGPMLRVPSSLWKPNPEHHPNSQPEHHPNSQPEHHRNPKRQPKHKRIHPLPILAQASVDRDLEGDLRANTASHRDAPLKLIVSRCIAPA